MRTRRTLAILLLAATAALTACGGDGGGGGAGEGGDAAGEAPSATATDTGTGTGTDTGTGTGTGGNEVVACDLLTPAEVEEAVGTPVAEGLPGSGPSTSGGGYTSCTWPAADPDAVGNHALLTVYDNAEAADSAREDDAVDLEGIGDAAFAGSVSSVWVYVGERSFLAQWYVFNTFDDEGLEQSQALARAAVDALG